MVPSFKCFEQIIIVFIYPKYITDRHFSGITISHGGDRNMAYKNVIPVNIIFLKTKNIDLKQFVFIVLLSKRL